MQAQVYSAINAVQKALAATGISKDRKNQQQGYSFRGIDDIYNVVSPLLAEHGLCILPRVLKRECVERQTAKGNALFYVTCEVEFDFIASSDGSSHVVKTWGEAMDSADKATNKAMSAAYKYAVMQAFAIPTEGDNDADAKTHEVKPASAPPPPSPPAAMAENSVADFLLSIQEAGTMDALKDNFSKACTAAKTNNDKSALERFTAAKDKRKTEIQAVNNESNEAA